MKHLTLYILGWFEPKKLKDTQIIVSIPNVHCRLKVSVFYGKYVEMQAEVKYLRINRKIHSVYITVALNHCCRSSIDFKYWCMSKLWCGLGCFCVEHLK